MTSTSDGNKQNMLQHSI